MIMGKRCLFIELVNVAQGPQLRWVAPPSLLHPLPHSLVASSPTEHGILESRRECPLRACVPPHSRACGAVRSC